MHLVLCNILKEKSSPGFIASRLGFVFKVFSYVYISDVTGNVHVVVVENLSTNFSFDV